MKKMQDLFRYISEDSNDEVEEKNNLFLEELQELLREVSDDANYELEEMN
jgi:hypothetical protein